MKTLYVLIFLTISLNISAEQPVVSKKFYKELNKFFGIENVGVIQIKELAGKNDIVFNLFHEEKELGIAVLSSAMGRHNWFDYVIIYNPDIEIQHIKVLVYRSEYGSEITAKRWLSQFYSRKEDSLKYGSDIQAISGATFSAISMTKNINRINKMLNEYFAE